MALNSKYVIAPNLQEYFVDKDSGEPLAGGKVFFYRDTNRTEAKTVYTLAGNQANYTYAPLPNPITLSSQGTVVDNNGNDVTIYYFPFNEDSPEEQDLYYIVVQNAEGVPQFTRQAWPNTDLGAIPGDNLDLINYIPNGQFLSHTNLEDEQLLPGSNVIAQGGFSIELADPLSSTNFVRFLPQEFTQNPPDSPRYICNFECTQFNPVDDRKWFRVKWGDVNKFSAQDGTFTFAFWASSNVSIPISIQVYKDFGTSGSPDQILTQATATITPDPQTFSFEINFGSNSGFTVDNINNDDFVAIDIVFPTTIGFNVNLVNFVLTPGNLVLSGFPLQTNADMITRGVFGWAETPDEDGQDLYLPAILTKAGMVFDRSQVGEIDFRPTTVEDPFQTAPIPQHNMINCFGQSYINEEFSANGIPFSRLGNYLFDENPHPSGLPLYGTGTDFISGIPTYSGVEPNYLRLDYNAAGVNSPLAADGAIPTGFDFEYVYDFNGSTTGTTDKTLFAWLISDIRLNCKGPVGTTFLSAPTAGTTPFTVSVLSDITGTLAFNSPAFELLTVPAASLVNGVGNPAQYWTFSNASTDFYMWFNIEGEIDPTPGGTGIEVRMESSFDQIDVAVLIVQALNSFNGTSININFTPPAGSYFTFQANPSALRNFYVWYQVDGLGTDPEVFGFSGIKVELLSSDAPQIIREKTQEQINRYQFAVPDFRGVFFRGTDPDQMFDTARPERWTTTPRQDATIFDEGTFQYDQFRSHDHQIWFDGQNANATGGTGPWVVNIKQTPGTLIRNTQDSGSNETRPVNTTVVPIIRY